MNEDQPFFRFNPGAYERPATFERSAQACDVCTRPCGWKYVGNMYALTSPTACARCIASGDLTRFLNDAMYALHDINLSGADPELRLELLQRTPGVPCFNPFEWPVLDGTPLAFLAYGEDEGLLAMPEVEYAMKTAFDDLGWDSGPSPYALIFKEIDGDRYRVAIDLC